MGGVLYFLFQLFFAGEVDDTPKKSMGLPSVENTQKTKREKPINHTELLQKSELAIKKHQWKEAKAALKNIAIFSQNPELRAKAKKKLLQVFRAQQEAPHFQKAKRALKRRRYGRALQSLKKIPSSSLFSPGVVALQTDIENRFIQPQMKRIKKSQERKKHKRALRIANRLLKKAPDYSPVYYEHKGLTKHLRSGCFKWCKRYRRRPWRRRRKCYRRCRKRYAYVKIPYAIRKDYRKRKAAQRNRANSALNTASLSQKQPRKGRTQKRRITRRCKRRCRYSRKRYYRCFYRWRRYYRKRCKKRCRRKRGYKRRRCYRSCRRKRYTYASKRRCRYSSRRLKRCYRKRCR